MEYNISYLIVGFALTNSMNYLYKYICDSSNKKLNYKKLGNFINKLKKTKKNYIEYVSLLIFYILENNSDEYFKQIFCKGETQEIQDFFNKYKIELDENDVDEILDQLNEKYLLNA